MDSEDGYCDGKNLRDCGDGDEGEVRAIVTQADVVAEPGAVMVETTNAVVASGAMTSPWWTPNTTGIAILDCNGSALVHESSFPDRRGCDMRSGRTVGMRYNTRIGSSGEVGGPDCYGEGDNDSDEKGDGYCDVVTKHPRE